MNYEKYCSLTYNDKLIDDILPGYQTINVEGRGLLNNEIKTINIDGADGTYIESQTLQSRELIVHFLIRANNNKERLDIIERLNLLLYSDKDVKVKFGDEEGFYLGRFAEGEDIPFDYFTGVGSFTIYCQKPYKFMEIKTYMGTTIQIDELRHRLLSLEEIKFTNTGETVTINNDTNGQKIKLDNLTETGPIVINKNKITLSNQNIISKLDPGISTWKGFKVKNGDTLSITGATDGEWITRRLL